MKQSFGLQDTSKTDAITSNVLLLVALLPLLVPFNLVHNLGLQALVVTLTGILAWFSVWQNKRILPNLPRVLTMSVALYSAIIVVSASLHSNQENLLGSPLMRLGALELLGCVGIGLCLRQIDTNRLIVWLYASIAVLGIISLPYSLWNAGHIVRVGGLLHQPDFLAATLSVGLLLGIELWITVSQRKRLALAIIQLYLLATVFLTQTRAVIVLLVATALLRVWLRPSNMRRRIVYSGLILLLLAGGVLAVKHATDGRLTDSTFASQSVSYRLVLQEYGAKAALRKPLLGYGAAGLKQALACPTLHDAALQHTCHSGYYFDSSHNIYLDRFLEFGLLGGVSFTALVLVLLWYGFQKLRQATVFAYAALLIALYYLTNVSSLEIELLFWIMLWRCLPAPKADKITS